MAKKRTKVESGIESGTYQVEVTIRRTIVVEADDSYDTEDDLLLECRRNGEMVDWEVERG